MPYDNVSVSRNTWLTLGLVVGAAAIWWAVLWEPMPEAEELAATDLETDQPTGAPTPPASPRPNEPTAPAAPPASAPSADLAPPAAPTEKTPTENMDTPARPQAAPTPDEQIPAPERTGPVDELKAAFDSEPRDSNATEPESAIQAAFRRPEVPSGLVKSVLCRSSVCKVETRWTPAGAAGFMGALMSLVASPEGAANRKFAPEIAVAPEGAPNANGERSIDVYLKRLDAAR